MERKKLLLFHFKLEILTAEYERLSLKIRSPDSQRKEENLGRISDLPYLFFIESGKRSLFAYCKNAENGCHLPSVTVKVAPAHSE
jgi:hypothetical protein